MKHYVGRFLLAACLLAGWLPLPVMAQQKPPTKKDIEKMKAEAMKEMEGLPPEEAEMARKILKEAESKLAKMPEGTTAASPGFLPARNTALLNSIPKMPLTRQSLQQHAQRLYDQVVARVSAGHQAEIRQLAANRNAKQLGGLAIAGWYYGNAPLTAVALAAKGCAMDPDDGVAVNNLAALLTLGGAPDKAVPVLRYLLVKYPKDAMVLNNLGQAYANMGAKDSAMVYLARCVKLSPKHPEANATISKVEASEGKLEQAAKTAGKSLEGAYNDAANELFNEIGYADRYRPGFRNKDMPDYFNAYKFELPRLQQHVNEAKQVAAETDAFRESLHKAEGQLAAIAEPEEEKGQQLMERHKQQVLAELRAGNTSRLMGTLPFSHLQMIFYTELGKKALAYLEEGTRWRTRLDETLTALREQHKNKQASISRYYDQEIGKYDCGEGNGKGCAEQDRLAKERCVKQNEAANAYLKARAVAVSDYQTKVRNAELQNFYFASTWGYLYAHNIHLARAAYYRAAQGYLARLREILDTEQQFPACTALDDVQVEKPLKVEWKFECPIDVKIPFIIGKIHMDCESMSFSAGEGATFKFTQNFKTKQSTLSISAGIDLKKSVELEGIIEGTLGIKLNETLYITYDGNKKATDFGLKFGSGVSAGYELSKGVKAVTGLEDGSVEGKFGYTVGINTSTGSHIEFEDGPLKNLFTPTEVQVNPKVGVYNGR